MEGIHLKEWLLSFNGRGLFVDGLRRYAGHLRSITRLDDILCINCSGISRHSWFDKLAVYLSFDLDNNAATLLIYTCIVLCALVRDNSMQWHSNVITERVSSNVVKTVSGNTYVLVGRMALDRTTSTVHTCTQTVYRKHCT